MSGVFWPLTYVMLLFFLTCPLSILIFDDVLRYLDLQRRLGEERGRLDGGT